jgi:hypothetical protein
LQQFLLQVPVIKLVFTVNFAEWHKRRKNEKLREVQLRKSRIFENPVDFQLDDQGNVPWYGLKADQLNEKFAYKPFTFYGEFNHGEEILVKRVRNGMD